MYAINYDGDWFSHTVSGGYIFSSELNVAWTTAHKKMAEYYMHCMIDVGYNPDSFEIVPVKIVRADED
jgi:hypothetical protein